MICTCGGLMGEGVHIVKTKKKAVEWLGFEIDSTDLPLTIDSNTCKSCGRIAYKVMACDGSVLKVQ